jgi:multidrug efflux pump subunit AcrA (membrane-fusion protein)
MERMNSSQRLKIIRAGLVIAIVAGFGVGALNGWKVREKIQRLQSSLAEQTVNRQKAETELAAAKRELGVTSAALTQTKAGLQAASEERDRAVAVAADQRTRAERLGNQLTASRQEADSARAQLARYKSTGMEPEQISGAAELIKRLRNDLGVAAASNALLRKQVQNLTVNREDGVIQLPPGLDGKVLAFDPKWQFVVLNAGAEQGILKGGELLVNRDGKLVAKVVVSRVEKDRCVATVLPGWGLGEIAEGDHAIPAHPGS